MSHQVLARKWRPQSFVEMVGQEHVLQALVNALDQDRLHHAYLFTGTRGVGKTTIARILARCLNCEQGVSSTPCGDCSSCLEITEGRSVDLLEVDAASRTKVEDTRELLENVQYAPTRSRYKVYLIDEVHMLSSHSFNALLKTLEEPPPHVIFLLATTDPHRLPATVLSRCLQFNLKNMPAEQIVGHLQHVLAGESVPTEEAALWLLGRAAQGSMRDALSLTDQAIAFGSGKVEEAAVRTMLGSVDLSFVYRLLEALAQHDATAVLAVIKQMAEHAPDYEGSLDELLSLLHRVTTAQIVADAIDNSWGDAEQVRRLAATLTAEDVQLFYQIGLHGKRDLGLAPDLRVGFEMVLLRMLAFRPALVIDDVEEKPTPPLQTGTNTGSEGGGSEKKRVKRGGSGRVSASSEQAERHAVVNASLSVTPVKTDAVGKPNAGVTCAHEAESMIQAVAEQVVVAAEAAVTHDASVHEMPEQAPESAAPNAQSGESGESGGTPWHELLPQLGLSGIVLSIASHCELHRRGELWAFTLDHQHASLYNDSHAQKIKTALEAHLGEAIQVTVTAGEILGESPAMRDSRLHRERQAAAIAAIEGDERLRALLTRFEGELDRASIAPIKPATTVSGNEASG